MFWTKTPHQLAFIIEGRSEQLMREHNDRAWLVHSLATLQRAKKIPALRELQARPRRRKSQSPEEMMAIARQWVIVMGGEIKAHGKG